MWLACCFDVAYGRVHARAPDPIISVILQVGLVMQCDIWVVFRGSISSGYKDTTRGEKQKQFFAGAMRRDTVHVFAICSA